MESWSVSSCWISKLSVSVLFMLNICYSPKVSWTDCYAWVWVHQCSGRAGGTSVRKVPVLVVRAEEAGEKRWYLFAVPLFSISSSQTKPQSLCLCQQDRWGRWEENVWPRLPFLQGDVLWAPGKLMDVHPQRPSTPLHLPPRRMLSTGQGVGEKGAVRGAAGCHPTLCAGKSLSVALGLLYSWS